MNTQNSDMLTWLASQGVSATARDQFTDNPVNVRAVHAVQLFVKRLLGAGATGRMQAKRLRAAIWANFFHPLTVLS